MKLTAETSLKRTIRDYLNLKRIFYWSNRQGLGSQKGNDILQIKTGGQKRQDILEELKANNRKMFIL